MQNNMTSQGLEVGIGKKMSKTRFLDVLHIEKKISWNFVAILYKKTWTAYFGVKLNLHSFETGKDF
jgi:hypothetical protein